MSDYTTWSVEKLMAERDRLAEQRTTIRLQQNAVDSVLQVKQAMEALPEGARRLVKIELGGSVEPQGEVS
jgi:hypothetical protein